MLAKESNHNCRESGGMKKKRSILKELIKVVRYEKSTHAFMVRMYSALSIFYIATAVIRTDYNNLFQSVAYIVFVAVILVLRWQERVNRYYAYLDGKARGMDLLMYMVMKAKEAKEQEGGES